MYVPLYNYLTVSLNLHTTLSILKRAKASKIFSVDTGSRASFLSSAKQRMRHLEYAGQAWSPLVIGIGDTGVQEMALRIVEGLKRQNQGVTKRCRLTKSARVYEPKCGWRGGVAGYQPMSTAVRMEPK
jgi:hypothetical protein